MGIHVTQLAAVVAGIAVVKKAMAAIGGCGRDDADEESGVVMESPHTDEVVDDSIDSTNDSHVSDGGDDDAAEIEQRAIVRINVDAIFGRVLARAAEDQNAADLRAANQQLHDAKCSIQEMTVAHEASLAARDGEIASLRQELAAEKRAHEQLVTNSCEMVTKMTNLEYRIKTFKLLEEEKTNKMLTMCDYVDRLEHEVAAVRDELTQTVAAAQQDAVDKARALDAIARRSADEVQAVKAQAAEEKAQLEMESAKERAAALADLKTSMEAIVAKEKAAAAAQQKEALARIAELDTNLADMTAAAALTAREMDSRGVTIAKLEESLATTEERLRDEHQLHANAMEQQLAEKHTQMTTLKTELRDVRDELANIARRSVDEMQALKAQAAEEKAQLEMESAKERAAVLSNMRTTLEKNAAKKKAAALSEQKALIERRFQSEKTSELNKQRVAMEDKASSEKAAALDELRDMLRVEFQLNKDMALMMLQSKLEKEHSGALRSLEKTLKSEFEAEKLQTVQKMRAEMASAAEVTLKEQLDDLRHSLGQQHDEAMTLAVKEATENRAKAMDELRETLLCDMQEKLEAQKQELTNAAASALETTSRKHAQELADFRESSAKELEDAIATLTSSTFAIGHQTKCDDEVHAPGQEEHDTTDAEDTSEVRVDAPGYEKTTDDVGTSTHEKLYDPSKEEEVSVDATMKVVHERVTAQNEARSRSLERTQITDCPFYKEEISVNDNTEIVTEQTKETLAELRTTKASHGSNTVIPRPLLERNPLPHPPSSSRSHCPQREQHAARRYHSADKVAQPGMQAHRGGPSTKVHANKKKFSDRHHSSPMTSAEFARRRMRGRHAQRSNGPRDGNSRYIATARSARTTSVHRTSGKIAADDEKHS